VNSHQKASSVGFWFHGMWVKPYFKRLNLMDLGYSVIQVIRMNTARYSPCEVII